MSFMPSVTRAQQPDHDQDDICFSNPDAQDILRKLKEHTLLLEQISLLKQSLVQRDREITVMEQRSQLLEDTLKNRDAAIDAHVKALGETKETIESAKKIIKEQDDLIKQKDKEVSKAKFLGFSVGTIGVALGILALIVAL